MGDDELLRGWRRDGERRAYEPTTLDRREANLRCFGRWLGTGLLTATQRDIEAFLDQRRWRGRRIAARARYKWLSMLSTFYDWTVREELLERNPTTRIVRPRVTKLLPRPWATEDMETALKAADPVMRCWLLMAAYAGARCCEISRLARADVLESWSPPVVVLHGKGSKDRNVPLHPRLAEALFALPMPRRGIVFIRPCGGGYAARRVSQEVGEFFRGLGMPWTAHQGRHWYGSQVLEASGGDLRLVQELLGHESIETTTIYTAWSKAKAAKAVAALPAPDDYAPPIAEEGSA